MAINVLSTAFILQLGQILLQRQQLYFGVQNDILVYFRSIYGVRRSPITFTQTTSERIEPISCALQGRYVDYYATALIHINKYLRYLSFCAVCGLHKHI